MDLIKRLLIATSFILFTTGCKKETDTTNTIFSFKANGSQYEWKGSLADTIYIPPGGSLINYIPNGGWRLEATPEGKPYYMLNRIEFLIPITTDVNLQEKTYSYDSFNVNFQTYLILRPKDPYNTSLPELYYSTAYGSTNLKITITKIRNDFASGSFSARLSPDMLITEGKFDNVPVVK